MGAREGWSLEGKTCPPTLFLHNSSGLLRGTQVSHRLHKSLNLKRKNPVSLSYPTGPAGIPAQAP